MAPPAVAGHRVVEQPFRWQRLDERQWKHDREWNHDSAATDGFTNGRSQRRVAFDEFDRLVRFDELQRFDGCLDIVRTDDDNNPERFESPPCHSRGDLISEGSFGESRGEGETRAPVIQEFRSNSRRSS